jgi:glutamyl-tRNA reductase
VIVSFHVTHYSAGADTIGDIIPSLDKNAEDFINSQPFVSEYVILKTCNRFEIYTACSDNNAAVKAFEYFARSNIPYTRNDGTWYTLTDETSIKHLFRVTCGLDSLVVGEDQIQGQVRDSYLRAKGNGHASQIMAKLFDKALHVGKRVRSETALNNGAVSIGSAAVELAKRKLGTLKGKTIVIIGAGDIATVVAKYLSGMDPNTIFVSSRTYEHAKILANQLNGVAIGFEHISDILRKSDLVIVATSASHILIDKKIVENAMKDRAEKLVIIDISIPRNVSNDVSQLPNVEVDTMDGITSISSENLLKRRNEIAEAEKIVNDELNNLDCERRERIANAVISEIGKKVSEIRKEELTTALARAENNSDIEKIFDDFSRALISKIMAEPYEKLKAASRDGHVEMCDVATDLFGVDKK